MIVAFYRMLQIGFWTIAIWNYWLAYEATSASKTSAHLLGFVCASVVAAFAGLARALHEIGAPPTPPRAQAREVRRRSSRE